MAEYKSAAMQNRRHLEKNDKEDKGQNMQINCKHNFGSDNLSYMESQK